MTCVIPSLLLSINQTTYRAVFTNRNKLAEVNIRMLGRNVELMDVLAHQRGYDLIYKFMNDEHSAENLLFWTAADQFESMLTLIQKQGAGEEAKSQVGPAGTSTSSFRQSNHAAFASDRSSNHADMVTSFVDPDDNNHSVSKNSPKTAHPHHPMYVHKHNENSSAAALLIANEHLHHHEQAVQKSKSNLLLLEGESGGPGWVRPAPSSTNLTASNALHAVSFANMIARQKGLVDHGHHVIDKFILPSAVECVNIPGKMRTATIENFSQWAQRVHKLMERASTATQSHMDVSFVSEEQELLTIAADLFTASKKEIYQLLKKDSYVRFRATKPFADFIDGMTPYSKQDTSVSRRYTASGKSSHRSSHSFSISRVRSLG
jgi:hypothetical protein